MPKGDLSANQSIFVSEYLVDRNGTRAYKIAYPSVKNDLTATSAASRLLTNVNVSQAIQEALQKQQARTEITADWTLKEIHKLAKFNAKKLFNSDGSLIPIQELDDDTAVCIGGVDVSQSFSGSGEDRQVETIKKVKIWDKGQALDKLARHFKLYDDTASGGASVPPVINIFLTPEKLHDGVKNG